MNASMVHVKDEQKVAEKTGLSVDQVAAGVVMFGNNAYVNTIGRRFKMDDRFGPGEWSASINPIQGEEYEHTLRMWGKKPPLLLYKAQITFNGKVLAEDYGWCTPESANSRKQFDEDGVGMAITKAVNRAMGQLIANGFASEEKADRKMVIETGSVEAGFLKDAAMLKKELGKKVYYEILNARGYNKSNDPELQGKPLIMKQILEEMRRRSLVVASEAVYGAPIHPDPDPPVTDEERAKGRQDLLDRILDDNVPVQAREDAVMDLLEVLEGDEFLAAECPEGSELSYIQIMAEYVSGAMVVHDFEKAHDAMKRAIDVSKEGRRSV